MTDHDERVAAQTAQRPRIEPTQLNQVDDAPVVETPVEARGGLLGRPILIVLAVSLILVILGGFLVGGTTP